MRLRPPPQLRRLAAFASALAALTLTTCAHSPPPQPPRPDALLLVDSSGAYKRWWREIEACAARRAPMRLRDVGFFVVIAQSLGVSDNGYVIAGVAELEPRPTIVLARPFVLRADIVRHEMLHLIASPGWHDAEMFQRRCAALVICVGSCVTDTEPRSGEAPPR